MEMVALHWMKDKEISFEPKLQLNSVSEIGSYKR